MAEAQSPPPESPPQQQEEEQTPQNQNQQDVEERQNQNQKEDVEKPQNHNHEEDAEDPQQIQTQNPEKEDQHHSAFVLYGMIIQEDNAAWSHVIGLFSLAVMPCDAESGQMVCGSCRRLLSYPRGSKNITGVLPCRYSRTVHAARSACPIAIAIDIDIDNPVSLLSCAAHFQKIFPFYSDNRLNSF
ncbi:hypothetical protein Cgig2_028897 [Carnegiea gigantea]|uniref:Zinc finger LSD1-type domain-containing protein n=1 Tax=Carnegiea gigantea TaxID=171969 RepID=A0A9Q1QNK2_9CARY|nr:hypothetical protein Cgig2_028897 [Carnegiea gigantea]